MCIETDSFRVFDIRKRVERKRFNTPWKDVDGETYIQDVECLLEWIEGLCRLVDESEASKETGCDSYYDSGYEEGYERGLSEGSRAARQELIAQLEKLSG